MSQEDARIAPAGQKQFGLFMIVPQENYACLGVGKPFLQGAESDRGA
jgi:hypothetical protein